VEFAIACKCSGREHACIVQIVTFDHLDVIGNEIDPFLNFQAWMTGFLQDQIAGTLTLQPEDDQAYGNNAPFSSTDGLTYSVGALTETWAKL